MSVLCLFILRFAAYLFKKQTSNLSQCYEYFDFIGEEQILRILGIPFHCHSVEK